LRNALKVPAIDQGWLQVTNRVVSENRIASVRGVVMFKSILKQTGMFAPQQIPPGAVRIICFLVIRLAILMIERK